MPVDVKRRAARKDSAGIPACPSMEKDLVESQISRELPPFDGSATEGEGGPVLKNASTDKAKEEAHDGTEAEHLQWLHAWLRCAERMSTHPSRLGGAGCSAASARCHIVQRTDVERWPEALLHDGTVLSVDLMS